MFVAEFLEQVSIDTALPTPVQHTSRGVKAVHLFETQGR